MPSLLLWPMLSYKRFWMQPCIIKSVNQIIRETNIPHTAYRKIKWIVEEKLPRADEIEIADDGKKFSLFHIVLKSFNFKYEYNNVVIEAEQNFDALKKVTEKLLSLGGGEEEN